MSLFNHLPDLRHCVDLFKKMPQTLFLFWTENIHGLEGIISLGRVMQSWTVLVSYVFVL